MFYVKFVHWAARIPNSDTLCDSFRSAGTNWRLNFSLFLLSSRGSVSCPCRMWPGFKELRLAKESVAPWRRSSASWMPERTGRLPSWSGTQASSDNAQKVIKNAVNDAGLRVATLSWCTVLSSCVDQGQGSCAQCLSTSAPS